jgi:hypothetical protein
MVALLVQFATAALMLGESSAPGVCVTVQVGRGAAAVGVAADTHIGIAMQPR